MIEGLAERGSLVEGLAAYRDHLRTDFAKFQKMGTDLYSFDVKFEEGGKFTRVVLCTPGGSRSAHSFVVNDDGDPKFPRGTILKAASWKAPAKNFSRGNVLNRDFSRTRWSGC